MCPKKRSNQAVGLQRPVANIVCHSIAVGFQTYGKKYYHVMRLKDAKPKISASPSLQTEGNILYYTTGLKTRGY